jgi:hypothetical protein
MFVGDSANKPNGVIYRYYKCAGAKRHTCDRKAFRKDWIEDRVINMIMTSLRNDRYVNAIADDLIALLQEGNEMIPALQAQLKDVRSALDNLMKAIEKGVFTRTTKARLEELEAEEERLIKYIQEEEAKIPKISKEMILYTLYKYRDMDMRVQKNRERLIDGFVKAIIVYDDYFKVHLTYTDEPIDMPTTEEIEFMDQSSDIASAVSPIKNPTPDGVGFFIAVRESNRSNATVLWTVAHARLDGHDTFVAVHSRTATQTIPARVNAKVCRGHVS